MKLWGLLAVLIIFSLCISESSQTTPPKTSPEPATTPHATTPSPTSPTPTPVPTDEELKWGKKI